MPHTLNIPTLKPVAVQVDRRGIRTVIIRCPFCSRPHEHGWPRETPRPGLRRSHCFAGDYRIEAA